MVKINGELKYGNKQLIVDINLDNVSGATALIGPNLSGKTLVLRCIFSRARHRIGRPIHYGPYPHGLTCDVERDDNYTAVYVDAYRVVNQLYETVAKDLLSIIKENAEFIGNEINAIDIRRAAEAIYDSVYDIKKNLNDFYVLELKKHADSQMVADATRLLNELYDEWMKKAEEAKTEFKDIFDDFLPLVLSATVDGFTWVDRKTGAFGQSLYQLSTAFSPALVILYAMYAYAIPQETYLLVEQPEAYAHPLTAFFIGTYLRRLVERSRGRLNIIAETHSFDFLRGFYSEEDTKVYVFRRFIEGDKIYLKVAGQWQGEGYVPGFSDATVFRLLLPK
jgi:hypothetical protein